MCAVPTFLAMHRGNIYPRTFFLVRADKTFYMNNAVPNRDSPMACEKVMQGTCLGNTVVKVLFHSHKMTTAFKTVRTTAIMISQTIFSHSWGALVTMKPIWERVPPAVFEGISIFFQCSDARIRQESGLLLEQTKVLMRIRNQFLFNLIVWLDSQTLIIVMSNYGGQSIRKILV